MEKHENVIEKGPKNRIMLFTGISGCGKDLILRQCLEKYPKPKNVTMLSFGERMAEKLNIKRDRLKHDLDDAQIKAIADEIVSEETERQPSVFNTHIVYEQNGSLRINLESLQKLNPAVLVFVVAEPKNIEKWRRQDGDREREVLDAVSIDLQQKISLAVAQTIAKTKGMEFVLIRNIEGYVEEDLEKLSESIKAL